MFRISVEVDAAAKEVQQHFLAQHRYHHHHHHYDPLSLRLRAVEGREAEVQVETEVETASRGEGIETSELNNQSKRSNGTEEKQMHSLNPSSPRSNEREVLTDEHVGLSMTHTHNVVATATASMTAAVAPSASAPTTTTTMRMMTDMVVEPPQEHLGRVAAVSEEEKDKGRTSMMETHEETLPIKSMMITHASIGGTLPRQNEDDDLDLPLGAFTSLDVSKNRGCDRQEEDYHYRHHHLSHDRHVVCPDMDVMARIELDDEWLQDLVPPMDLQEDEVIHSASHIHMDGLDFLHDNADDHDNAVHDDLAGRQSSAIVKQVPQVDAELLTHDKTITTKHDVDVGLRDWFSIYMKYLDQCLV